MIAAALAVVSGMAAAGDQPTREFASPYSSLRLMNAGKQSDAWRSGIHITMQQGWKTYWRVPGDGGVPPSFDWSGSENVEAVKVMMPLPHRFTDENGEGIGYKTERDFPGRCEAKGHVQARQAGIEHILRRVQRYLRACTGTGEARY